MKTKQQIYIDEIEMIHKAMGKPVPLLQSDLIRKFVLNCLTRYETEIEQSHKHGVMQAMQQTKTDRWAIDMMQLFFEKGARWAITKMSSSPTVGQRSVGQNGRVCLCCFKNEPDGNYDFCKQCLEWMK